MSGKYNQPTNSDSTSQASDNGLVSSVSTEIEAVNLLKDINSK